MWDFYDNGNSVVCCLVCHTDLILHVEKCEIKQPVHPVSGAEQNPHMKAEQDHIQAMKAQPPRYCA